MEKLVTIVITPRDRYSELAQCVKDIYEYTDNDLFELIVLDLGYPAKDLWPALAVLKGRDNYKVIDYGRIIPIEAMDRIRGELSTKYTVFMDNDSRALAGWLSPLIETAENTGAAVISPVILERAGVDEGADLRNHLFTTELKIVAAQGNDYLIEYKSYRRASLEQLPTEITETSAFELHCVMFNTAVLRTLELPRMTIREHLDIGLQLKSRGLKLVVDPRSRIVFDNLGTRANLSDLKYFDLRWNRHITWSSSRLFEKRWGYKFYSEESIYNWAIRRRIFLLLRWLHLPIVVVNKIDRLYSAIRRRLFPIWDPLEDPYSNAILLYDKLSGSAPQQLDHSLNLKVGSFKINVLIVVNSMEKGGRTKRIAEEYQGLLDNGHHVKLVTFSAPPDWVLEHYPSSGSWIVMEKNQVKMDFLLAFKLLRLMINHKVDVVHSHCETSALYTGIVSKFIRVKSVGTVHRSDLRFYATNWKRSLYYRFLNGYVAVSNERKERMIHQFGLSEDKVQVIHWGIDPNFYPIIEDQKSYREKLGLTDQYILLSLGHLGQIKGHDESISAVSMLQDQFPTLKLYIGGDGEKEDFDRLKEQIENLKLQDAVVLLGQLTNPMDWMAACDIFLQPSREEAFGLVFIEAGLRGKPTVATRVGGIPEIIIDGETGFLVDPESPEQIAEKVACLLSSKEKLTAMGRAARNRVEDKFNLAEQVSKLESYFESLL